MKLIHGAAIAAMLLVSPALAQETNGAEVASQTACGVLPEAPSLPDGANASRRDMSDANTRVTAWVAASEAVLQCMRAEITAATELNEARTRDHNARLAVVRDAVAAWTAETEEFNARSSRR